MAKSAMDGAWPHIDPGKKRHKIQIQAQSSTQDTFGEQLNTWTTIRSCFAEINTTTTREQFQDGFVSQVVHEVKIDWPGMSLQIFPNMRVVVHPFELTQASVYEIQTVENVQQRNLVTRMICLEIDNAKLGTS